MTVAGGTVCAARNHAAVALNAATGRQLWSRTLLGNDHEGMYAFNATTGAILLKTPLSAGTNAPVTIDGGYVLAGAGAGGVQSASQRALIIGYKLGGTGKLPHTVGS